MLSDLDLAYMAGFLDGEGSISIYRRGQTNTFVLSVKVAQKDRRPLELFRSEFGGYITRGKISGVHYWGISCKAASSALSELLPFLIVKKEEALIGIEFQRQQLQTGGRKITPEQIVYRQECINRIMAVRERLDYRQ